MALTPDRVVQTPQPRLTPEAGFATFGREAERDHQEPWAAALRIMTPARLRDAGMHLKEKQFDAGNDNWALRVELKHDQFHVPKFWRMRSA